MKTLIIHPEDDSTTFLSPIYAPIKNKTVITGGVNKDELRRIVESHDRIMMLGHGSPFGLLSVNQFISSGTHIIDKTFIPVLKSKKNNIYIWCYANEFVEEHELIGFCSGMFISEVLEAEYMGFKQVVQKEVNQSNSEFSRIVACYIDCPLHEMVKCVKRDYQSIAAENRIAAYNLLRLACYN